MIDRWKAQESRAALPALRQRLTELNNELRNALQAADRFQDPDGFLSPEGVQDRQRQMRELARQTFAKKRDALEAEKRQYVARARDWAESKRPKAADDAVQLQKMSMAWDRVRPMLEAGHSVPAILARSTAPVMVMAVRERAGDWLMAQQKPQGLDGQTVTVNTAGLARSADDRLAELMGGEVAEAVAMLRDIDAAEGSWAPVAQFVDDALAGRRQDPTALMSAAIESHFAEQQARMGYQEPEAVPDQQGEGAAV